MQKPNSTPASRGPTAVLILGVLLIVGGLIATAVWMISSINQPRPAAPPQPVETAQSSVSSQPAARLAVMDHNNLYTIDPDGSHQTPIDTAGSLEHGALIWSRDNTRLIYATTDGDRGRLMSVGADNSKPATLYDADAQRVPFYIYGSPDDQYVAFLQTDPQVNGLHLQLAATRPLSAVQSIATGQPNYFSWSPKSDALLVHIGGTARTAFIATYQLGDSEPKNTISDPAMFQTPGWSPIDQRLLYARNYLEGGQLIVADGVNETPVLTFPVGIAFSWSPDAQHIAYSYNDTVNFGNNTLSVINADGQAAHTYFSGEVVAFFWSPDGQRLAYLTVDTTQPGPVGRIGGLAAPRVKQQPTAYFTWHAIDLQTQHTINLISFEPADAMVYMAQYFDQFAQSIEVWSPDSQSLVLAGTPLNGQSGVYVIDASTANSPATYVGPGDFAIWSWK